MSVEERPMADAAVWSTVLTALAVCAVVGVVVTLVVDDRDPSIVLAWLLMILLLPVLGVVSYFFVGRNYRRAARRHDGEVGSPLLPAGTPATAGPAARVRRLAEVEGPAAPAAAETMRTYFTGAEKFADLLADLRAAEHQIDLMYLIWECDELTARVTEVLQDRLEAGVRVRILYDWLSSAPYRKRELKALARAGASVRPCYRRLRQLNYRNHMKMVLVDREVVYSGGMNMGQEYVDGGPRFATWRDTHFRMTGSVVARYSELFDTAWARNGPSDDEAPRAPASASVVAPPAEAAPVRERIEVQVLHSSVSTAFPSIRDAFIVALTSARDRVWIQSPYFVPDEPLLTAMCVAASSGVEVRLMMTGHPDKKLPFNAAHAYFPTVLRSGVQVLLYDAGFLHAKTVTVDDELVVVGTCNWDIRSLLLHDEVVALVYDRPTVKRFADQYEADLQHARAVTLADVEGRSPWQTGRDSLSRLTSRLL